MSIFRLNSLQEIFISFCFSNHTLYPLVSSVKVECASGQRFLYFRTCSWARSSYCLAFFFAPIQASQLLRPRKISLFERGVCSSRNFNGDTIFLNGNSQPKFSIFFFFNLIFFQMVSNQHEFCRRKTGENIFSQFYAKTGKFLKTGKPTRAGKYFLALFTFNMN